MRILVCFHTLADLELLSEKDWQEAGSAGTADTSYLKKKLNCYDESALELACRAADICRKRQESCLLDAVTVGGAENDGFLDTLSALGYTRTERIDPGSRRMETFSAEEIAGILLAWIRRQKPYDLILTGLQSGDGNRGMVPHLIAAGLQIPCIGRVTDFRPEQSGRQTAVVWEEGGCVCTACLPHPFVMAVGNAAQSFLRVPTLRQRMEAGRQGRSVSLVSAEELISELPAVEPPSDELPVRFCGMRPVSEKRDTVTIDGVDPDTAAGIMLEYFQKWAGGTEAKDPSEKEIGWSEAGQSEEETAHADGLSGLKYAVIIDEQAPDREKQAGRIRAFLLRSGLKAESGTAIVFGLPEDFESQEKILERFPFPEVIAVTGGIPSHLENWKLLKELCPDTELFLFSDGHDGDLQAAALGAHLSGSTLTGVTQGDGSSELTPEGCSRQRPYSLTAQKLIYSGHMEGSFILSRRPFVLSLAAGEIYTPEPVNRPSQNGSGLVIPGHVTGCVSQSTGAEQAIEQIIQDRKERKIQIKQSRQESRTQIIRGRQKSRVQIMQGRKEGIPVTRVPAEKPAGLAEARIAVVGGMGIGSRKNMEEIFRLAETAGIPMAGSRPAVMNGWLPISRLAGVSGLSLSPEICILLGVSGAPALMESLKGSAHLIAVNTDPDAPVMRKADLAIRGDCMEVFRRFVQRAVRVNSGFYPK